MKNYLKPELIKTDVISNEKLSSLANWLEDGGAGYEYANAGITTYVLES